MAAVTAAPGPHVLLRRAARIASRVKGDLDVVHVIAGDTSPPADGRSIGGLRELTADPGARWHEIEDDDPARALVSFAHGPPRRPDQAGRHDLVFIGPGRLRYTWGPVGAMLAGLVT
jgi:hypothetical protein